MVAEDKCLVVTTCFAAREGLWAIQINDGTIHAVHTAIHIGSSVVQFLRPSVSSASGDRPFTPFSCKIQVLNSELI